MMLALANQPAGAIARRSGPEILRAYINLSDMAAKLDVAIILMTLVGAKGKTIHLTHGLKLDSRLSRLADIAHKLCCEGVTMRADISSCRDFAGQGAIDLASLEGRHFFVGIPVLNDDGQITASMALLDHSRHIARRGCSIREMQQLARRFLTDSQWAASLTSASAGNVQGKS
jgi:hypothetical protein